MAVFFYGSGIPESNWRLDIGNVMYCHYTNPAIFNFLFPILPKYQFLVRVSRLA